MKSLSLMKKFLVSLAPILLVVLGNSYLIYTNAADVDEEIHIAVMLNKHLVDAEIASVSMSEHLRGYLLQTNNTAEFEAKKAADENYVKAMSSLAELVKAYPETAALVERMQKYDETEVDRVENEVGDKIKANDPNAGKFYFDTYMPIRKIQNENFSNLKTLVSKHSADLENAAHQNGIKDAIESIISLFVSGLFMFILLTWVMKSAINSITDVTNVLKKSTDELKDTSGSISAGATTLSESNSEQAASLQETASSLEEISSMVAKSTDNAKKTSEATVNAQRKAEEGKGVITEMMASMDEINSSNESIQIQVTKSNEQMSEIIQIIQEIGNKTKVINDIVFQTKLLSFNASVEAARAGEHGKGFAVVAEEVGNLAAMSGSSAHEITEMLSQSIQKVENIVSESKANIEGLITTGKDKVSSGVETAKRCGSVFEEIFSEISSVSKMAEEISVASLEQSRGISEINRAISQLDQVTQQNSATSAQAAASAQALASQAGNLQEVVVTLVETIEGAKEGGLPKTTSKQTLNKPVFAKTENKKSEAKPQSKKEVLGAARKKITPLPETKKASEVPDHNHSGFTDV